MAIVVGIDEAGYGPILGPLVISASVFEMPDERLRESLWEILRNSVCKKLAGRAGRIAINDSKKLHHGIGDYEHLQRGVLAGLGVIAMDRQGAFSLPATLGELLILLEGQDNDRSSSAAPPLLAELAVYPWYGPDAGKHPLCYDRNAIELASSVWRNDMDDSAVRLLGLWSNPVPEGRFNRMIDAVKNKATVEFSLVSELIQRAWERYADQNLQIVVDRLGGRMHYRSHLQRLFPDRNLKILKENESVSSYEMRDGGRGMKIHFLIQGEDRHLPVALASMTSKYIRELFMERFNRYFEALCPGIAPTAGYYQDGQRFLADLKGKIDPVLVPGDLLIRKR